MDEMSVGLEVYGAINRILEPSQSALYPNPIDGKLGATLADGQLAHCFTIYSHDSKAIPSKYTMDKFYGIQGCLWARQSCLPSGFRFPCRSSIKKKIYVSR